MEAPDQNGSALTGSHRLSNASKRLPPLPPPPWTDWPEDPEGAEHAIRWIETWCRPPKGYGAGEPLRLAPFQKEWLREVLADGVTSAVMSCPRGQGKSTLLAALGLWATFNAGKGGAPQVPVVATTVMQAHRSVYGVALAMVAAEEELADRALVYSAIGAMKIVVPGTGGEMFPVSSDPAGLQGLDPSLAICDEVGFQSVESWESLLLASGKRPRSLVVGIGTPGYDEENALWMLRQRALDGAAIPGFRFTEYAAAEGCNVRDEDEWARANPALAAGYMNPDALRAAVELSPEASFRTFRLGQWVDGIQAWLGEDGRRLWDSLRDPWVPVSGAQTWVGVDVGQTKDSTALVATQQRDDGRWHVWCRLWVPAPGREVDISDVAQHIRDLDRDFELVEVSYDRRLFDMYANQLLDEGLPMVEIPQSAERMVPATGTAYEMIRRREISHDGDEAFARQVLNAMAQYTEHGFRVTHRKARGRMDAAVALVLALDRVVRGEKPAAEMYVV